MEIASWRQNLVVSLSISTGQVLPQLEGSINKLTALSLALWFSLLAPLSWMVIFKGHSYIHTHMNFITWHMPFTILGFGLMGAFLSLLVATIYNLRPNQRK